MIALYRGHGGTVTRPEPGHALIDRRDGGHLLVSPARVVWERSELAAGELAAWSALVAATGRAMLETLPQLAEGCVNYWEASNWLLHDDAPPAGRKDVRAHRDVHLHVIGRSRSASSAAWRWGEAPEFPRFADRERWMAGFVPLTREECEAVGARLQALVVEPPPCALVIFDLIGTLVHDGGAVAAAFSRALAAEHLHVTPEQIAGLRGLDKREAWDRLAPAGIDHEATVASLAERFRTEVARAVRDGRLRPMGGAADALAALRRRGVRVALTTGCDRATAARVLDGCGWATGVFDAVVCADDVPAGRPAPFMIFRAMEMTAVTDVRAVAVVGDTTVDLAAGHRAHVGWNIGVLSGAHSRAQLLAAPHTSVMPSVAGVPAGVLRDVR